MPPRSRSEAGFSLLEVLVALGLTVVLMTGASQMIVTMKTSSDRMRISAEAKLRAQQGLDYLAMNVRGATDMNAGGGNPAALMVWYEKAGNPVQASWNNVTNPVLADIGTDIITVGKADTTLQSTNITWPGFQHGSNARWEFGPLCPDGGANLAYFKDLTRESGGASEPVLLVDATGRYGFYQITNYLDAWNTGQGCNQNPPEIHVIANPGNSQMLNPPSGQPTLVPPISMTLGVNYYTFRVRDGWLEQKVGMFDPTTDNPGTAFAPLIPNIEDFQIAWAFTDGSIWNTSAQQLQAGTYTNNVPTQGGTGQPYDVINCNALRITIVARSGQELADPEATLSRPPIEDRAGGPEDRFFHHRATTLVMIRNRNLLF